MIFKLSTLFKVSNYLLCSMIFVQFACSNDDPGMMEQEEQEQEQEEQEELPSPLQYSFFVAGHTYGKPEVDNVGFHPPFKEKFELIQNDERMEFGVLTGDIVIYSTVANWDEVDADVELLGEEVYFAVGNHDMTNRPLFESRYGDTYRSFIQNGDLYITLDPNIDQWNISGDQLVFLQNTLQSYAGEVDNIFVFFHQVLWWEPDNIYQNIKSNSWDGRAEEINFWTQVEPLFNDLSNEVYMFAGDVGATLNATPYMYHNYNNITLIASGMGKGTHDNFVIVDVKEDKTVSFRLIAINGDDINALGRLTDYVLP